MTAASLSPPDPIDWRAVLREPGPVRRGGALAAALALHGAALLLLLLAPPAAFDPARRAVEAVEVRLYTVAGGAEAESDAPLFEPPMAEAPEAGDAAGAVPAPVVLDPEPADPAEAVAETAPETAAPEDDASEEAAPDEPTDPVSELAADAEGPAAPDETRPGGDTALREGGTPPRAAPPAPTAPGAPVATTQITPPERGEAAAARPPSFADILARAETRLDPADFRIAKLLGGVRGATRESFCLSSASGNRDAMDCPDAPNADSAALARYGLMGLGEEAPEFMVDMDRLEFQLRTLGADDGAISRILLGLREARREAIETSPIVRQMERDREPGSP